MTTADVVKRLEDNRPASAEDLLKACYLPLEYINEGAFRSAYRVIGCGVVVKVPHADYICDEDYRYSIYFGDCLEHAAEEYKIFKRINRFKKYAQVRQYMPEIHYFDKETGVTLVSEYNQMSEEQFEENTVEIERLHNLIAKLTGTHDPDVYVDRNVALDHLGQIKIIDLGCFTGKHE